MTSKTAREIDPKDWFTPYCITNITADNLECKPGYFKGYEGENLVFSYVVEIWRTASGRENSGTKFVRESANVLHANLSEKTN